RAERPRHPGRGQEDPDPDHFADHEGRGRTQPELPLEPDRSSQGITPDDTPADPESGLLPRSRPPDGRRRPMPNPRRGYPQGFLASSDSDFGFWNTFSRSRGIWNASATRVM